jgi:tetratricopeptide (TPR) repeat protein
LVFVTLLAFLPALRAGFIWDDDIYVTENPLLTASNGLRRIWFSLDSPSQYFPLTYTTFYLERRVWGLNPAGYHAVNLLLHAANALLVWRLLARLRLPGAWLGAALFALHPVQVESVAWITERKNVLMGFFFLLSLLAWTRFVEETSQSPWRPCVSEGGAKGGAGSPLPVAARTECAPYPSSPRHNPWLYYGLALVSYALALCAKTTACTLPAALLLVMWLKKMPLGWRRWAQVGPFVVLGMGMGLVTVWWERFHQGTQGAVFSIGPVERVLIASRALWFYAGKLVWPTDLTFSYPRWTISASDASAYVWLLATAALGVVIWRARRRVGRGVEVAAVFFAATLSPMLGFIMLWTFRYSFVADHYQYLACLGPLALAAAGMAGAFGWAARRDPLFKPICCAVLLAGLGALTWVQCGQYAGVETLWRATLANNPDSWLAHNELGAIMDDQGKLDEAASQFKVVLDLHPDDEKARNNLGFILIRKGQVVEAIEEYRKALGINPDYAIARNNLGNALLLQGEVVEAISEYRMALDINPDYAKAHNNLGNALVQRGALVEAVAHFRQALNLQPNFAEARNSLGNALLLQGEVVEAIAQFRQALDLHPNYTQARQNLGLALLRKGDFDGAMACFEKTATLPPDPWQRWHDIGKDLLKQGFLIDSIACYRQALSINPSLADGWAELGMACLSNGQYKEAEESWQKALTLAQAQKDDKLAGALQEQLKLYQAGRPMRQTK